MIFFAQIEIDNFEKGIFNVLIDSTVDKTTIKKFENYIKTKDIKLRDEIFLENENLVFYTLKNYKKDDNYEDLLQEGRIGLLYAIDNYNPQLGYTFSTYACKCIQGYVYKAMNTFTNLHFPKSVREQMIKLQKIRSSGFSFTIEEIAKKMELPVKEIEKLDRYIFLNNVSSLDSFVDEDDDKQGFFFDLYEGDIKSPEEIIDEQNMPTLISEVIALATPNIRHQKIIKEYFGIGCKPKSYREIGEIYNLSHQRVNKIISDIIARLRSPYKIRLVRKTLSIPDDLKNEDIISYLFYTKKDYKNAKK